MKFSPESPIQNPKQKRRIDPRQEEIKRLQGQQRGDHEAYLRLRELMKEEQAESRKAGRTEAPHPAHPKTSEPVAEPTSLPDPSQDDVFPKHERNDQPHL